MRALGARTSFLALTTSVLIAISSALPVQARPAHVIRFHGLHYVHDSTQADKYLAGTPRGFRRWAARHGHNIPPSSDCNSPGGVVIRKYDTKGFAFGFEGVCSAPEMIWAHVHGHWRVAAVTQDAYFNCRDLARRHVPSELGVHHCFTADGSVIGYHQD